MREKKGELKDRVIAVPDDLKALAAKVVSGLEDVGVKVLGEQQYKEIAARFGRVFGLPTPPMLKMDAIAVDSSDAKEEYSANYEESKDHTPVTPSASMTSMVSEASSEGYGQEDPNEEYFDTSDVDTTSLSIAPSSNGD